MNRLLEEKVLDLKARVQAGLLDPPTAPGGAAQPRT